MRKVAFLFTAASALLGTSAAAQSVFMQALPDTLAQVAGRFNASSPDACYDGRWLAKAQKNIAKGGDRAELLMQRYREQGVAGGNMKKLFIDSKARWTLDGQRQDVRDLHDPWIPKIARLERMAVTVGNWGMFYHVQWRALAADGSQVGIYDALLNSTATQFTWLDLYSPAATGKPAANAPFCDEPGDVEKWQEAKARRDAEKAAKAAAQSASRQQ